MGFVLICGWQSRNYSEKFDKKRSPDLPLTIALKP